MINHFRAMSCTLLSALLLLSGCAADQPPLFTYTLHTYTSAMPDSLHPHTRTADADYAASFTETGFVIPGEKDEWQYEMAESITDITESFSDKEKWGIDEDSGRVFRIVLNQRAVWSDGTDITADTYIDSMKQLLAPDKQYSRALPYTVGNAAIFCADDFRRSGEPLYAPCVAPYDEDELADYSFDLEKNKVFLHLTSRAMTLTDEYSIQDIYEAGYIDPVLYDRVSGQADVYGYIPVTEENKEDIRALAERVLIFFGLRFHEDYYKEMLFYRTGEKHPSIPFTQVGLIKAGLYELTYITAEQISLADFLACMTVNWIVHPDGDGDSLTKHPSYGPYQLVEVSGDHLGYYRNSNWYGWSDGRHEELYASESVHCAILIDEDAALLFERGKLDLLFDSANGLCKASARVTGGTDVRTIRYLYDDAGWREYIKDRGGYPYR